MAASPETVSMAMFCDFENVALGVRDAHALGAAIGYSESSTRRALRELADVGVVFAIAYGKRTIRHRYAGVPAQLLPRTSPHHSAN